jgi:hypothetical protein
MAPQAGTDPAYGGENKRQDDDEATLKEALRSSEARGRWRTAIERTCTMS